MVFLNIYIGFSVLTFILLLMQSYVISKQIERKYPDTVKEFSKKNKSGVLEKVCEYIQIFISCFIPIVNIGIFYVSLFKSEELEEKALSRMLKNKRGF